MTIFTPIGSCDLISLIQQWRNRRARQRTLKPGGIFENGELLLNEELGLILEKISKAVIIPQPFRNVEG